ncbi:MAG: 1-acyl-sn-glycerol-3-phosphate acyltransferase [Solirubrobacterales bacterium]
MLRRRLIAVPALYIALFVVTLALPVLLVAGALIDLVRILRRRRAVALRVVAALWWYLLVDSLGLLAFFLFWLASGFGAAGEWLTARTYDVQRVWGPALFRGVARAFGLTLRVEGIDLVRPGPILLLMRHASLLDTLLPLRLVTGPTGMRLRYVMKRELRAEPCIDFAGSRLPNYFIDRSSRDTERELDALRALSRDLKPDEGVLIWPEGTRFEESVRVRAIERIAASDPGLAARASELNNVLPPRLSGVLALLERDYEAVVICTHHGFDGVLRISDIASGRLVGRTITVRFTRYAAAEIPDGREARVDWLYDRWEEVDAWVAEQGAEQQR